MIDVRLLANSWAGDYAANSMPAGASTVSTRLWWHRCHRCGWYCHGTSARSLCAWRLRIGEKANKVRKLDDSTHVWITCHSHKCVPDLNVGLIAMQWSFLAGSNSRTFHGPSRPHLGRFIRGSMLVLQHIGRSNASFAHTLVFSILALHLDTTI